ncbi:MAG: IclR family transcriptional regulator [Xanthobacteraceae bacterium]|nr:IclR family transcriptional regulator [Xanthobacteraceae bacterium]
MTSKRARPRTRKLQVKAGAGRGVGAGGADARYLVPALDRGLQILQTLAGDRRKLSLSEIAAALGVTRSSAYRLLYTLGHFGFVDCDPETKNYMLGSQVLRLGYGYLASRDLVEVAMPHLVRLRDRTSWSAHLGELHGRDVLYLARVPTRRSIASTVHVGTRLPAHATAMGRILLSQLSEAEVLELYQDEPAVAPGAAKAVDAAGLVRQLAEDRASGVVVQNAVYEPGVASVAAPIHDVTGKILAAINISTVALFTTDAELNGPLKAEVLAAARAISHDLGRHDAYSSADAPHDDSLKQVKPQRRNA